MAVTYKHTPDGGYEISRVFRSLPAAMRGASLLESVCEAAFGPPGPPPVPTVEFEADPLLRELVSRCEAADDPEPATSMGINNGTAYLSDHGPNPVSQTTGD